MKHYKIQSNFIPPVIKPEDYIFGSGQLQGAILRENGDWRDYVPQNEDQRKKIETSACASYGTINAIEILMEETFGLIDMDYSERFISFLSGTTPQGNTPNKVAQAIRDNGLIPEAMLPFKDAIDSFQAYNSFEGADEQKCRAEGQQWLKQWDFGYDWVFYSDIGITEKYAKLREALKFSPIGISTYAWVEDGGLFIKPKNSRDNHWVLLIHIDEDGYPYVFDTYPPYIKKLAKNYDFGFAMRYSLAKKEIIAETKKESWLIRLKRIFKLWITEVLK